MKTTLLTLLVVLASACAAETLPVSEPNQETVPVAALPHCPADMNVEMSNWYKATLTGYVVVSTLPRAGQSTDNQLCYPDGDLTLVYKQYTKAGGSLMWVYETVPNPVCQNSGGTLPTYFESWTIKQWSVPAWNANQPPNIVRPGAISCYCNQSISSGAPVCNWAG